MTSGDPSWFTRNQVFRLVISNPETLTGNAGRVQLGQMNARVSCRETGCCRMRGARKESGRQFPDDRFRYKQIE